MREVTLFPRASPQLQLHQRVLTWRPTSALHLTYVPFQGSGTYSLWTGSSFPQRMEPHPLCSRMPYHSIFPLNAPLLFMLFFVVLRCNLLYKKQYTLHDYMAVSHQTETICSWSWGNISYIELFMWNYLHWQKGPEVPSLLNIMPICHAFLWYWIMVRCSVFLEAYT